LREKETTDPVSIGSFLETLKKESESQFEVSVP